MLLSSQAFSGFLQELSQSGLPPPNFQKSLQQQKLQGQTQSQSQPLKKDVSTKAATQKMQSQHSQIGMALIPDTPVDYSLLQPSNGWMNALPTNDFQVYAVTDIPAPPVLDLEALSGKPTWSKDTSKAFKQSPRLPELPAYLSTLSPAEPTKADDSIDLDQDAFALYFASSTNDVDQNSKTADCDDTNGYQLSDEKELAALEQLCSDLEDSCEKLAEYTSHME